jgi:hypothetical protein
MTAETFRTRIVRGCLATIFLSFGTILADTTPATESPVASPVSSGLASAPAPLAPASSQAVVPWTSESLVQYSPAGMSPLKPADEAQPVEQTTQAKPKVPDVPVPATVQNVHRAGGQ